MKNILLTLVTVLMVSVSLGYAQPVFEHRSLEEALNPDGTLKQGVQGSFSVKGYTMRTGANGEPIFLPHLQNTASGTWDTQFGLPVPGVAGTVNALVFDGQGNVYVGGSFGAVGGVSTPINSIARYNIATNSWSALGTGAQNGVGGNSIPYVSALAVDRSGRVYVGGRFTQAGGFASTYIARWTSGASRIEQIGADVPRTFLLEQNYPNPFNPSTTIRYQLPVASEVKLEVYDVLGKKVAKLVNERQAAGVYQVIWNANGLSSGTYFYRLQAGQFVQTRKMMLVK